MVHREISVETSVSSLALRLQIKVRHYISNFWWLSELHSGQKRSEQKQKLRLYKNHIPCQVLENIHYFLNSRANSPTPSSEIVELSTRRQIRLDIYYCQINCVLQWAFQGLLEVILGPALRSIDKM